MNPGPDPSAVPQPPAEPRSPGVAWLLSLALPGLGQLYCGKHRRGILTLALFAAAAAATALMWRLETTDPAAEMLMGTVFRIAVFLHVFAGLDAFLTAREITSGADRRMTRNPRVAAILNLLTNGFGYFYLGQKGKGVICFMVLGAVNRVVRQIDADAALHAIGAGLELLLAAIAIDAYRIALRDNRQAAAAHAGVPLPLQPSGGLPLAVPAAVGTVFCLSYFGLQAVGMAAPSFEPIDKSRASIRETADGRVYGNPSYGIEFTAPDGWAVETDDPDSFVEATLFEGGCRAALVADTALPTQHLPALADALVDEILDRQDNFRLKERVPDRLAGHEAHVVTFMADVDGTDVMQNYVMTRHRMALYTLVETFVAEFKDDCAPGFAAIRRNLKLPGS